MGVILDVNWRRLDAKGNNIVGWPTPSATQGSAYRRIAEDAALYRSCGFTAVGFPPSTKGAAGEYSGGYDLMDPYDIGSKNQPYAVPTAFGTAEELRRAVARVHAAGMQAYGDLVMHQYDGFDPMKPYAALGADGKARSGRFPKTPSCFANPPPGVPADTVPDSTGNFAFGALAAYEHSTPPGYMIQGNTAAVQWLRATTGFDGLRIDEAKGLYVPAVLDALNAKGMEDAFAFGEYFDGNPAMVSRWVNNLMHRRASVLDFAFKFNTGNICNNNSRAWMGALSNIGWCAQDPFTAVTFCESADTDNSPGQQTAWNKILQYAIMLTFPGYPRVYYRDWSHDDGCYGLMEPINNLIYIHERFANGPFVPRWDNDPQVFVHERTGLGELPGCIAGFNNDQYHEHTVTVQTTKRPNARLHEMTGKYDTDIWADGQGRVTFTLPPNNNGYGYLVFAEWIQPEAFGIRALPTTQTFFGASDLDTPPLGNGVLTVGRIDCADGTPISLELSGLTLPAGASVVMRVLAPPSGIEQLGTSRPGATTLDLTARASGLHTVQLSGDGFPVGTASPFELKATYQADLGPL